MMDQLSDIAIVIPVYEASAKLRQFVDELLITDVSTIIVVDDGSTRFSAAIELNGITDRRLRLLAHTVNEGKGRALKTGFHHILSDESIDVRGVITADADGQHLVTDVLAVATASLKGRSNLVIGSRKFYGADVPLRSRFGNSITRGVFKIATGVSVRDTQSGLRFLPRNHLQMICQIKGERYEFELRMLTEIASQKIGITQTEISTTYIDGNRSSHFRPLMDSVRIYAIFARYCGVSAVSAFIDLILFGLIITITQSILISTYTARAGSASFNFYGNRRIAFSGKRQKHSVTTQAGMYIALAFFSATLSAVLLQLASGPTIPGLILTKAGIDIGLFLLNFGVQKIVVFGQAGSSNR